ncbi:MAG TPA: cytochrome c-type biogenesis protein [Candidatus Krumholzibacteria bacterium]|nr:cytochrome c-type biogenesis protein [Candidatus Krumholzibacteria bacterium]
MRSSGVRNALFLLVVFQVVLASTSFAQSAKTTLRDPEQAKRFNEISDRLICQCGCNMVLRVCNHQNCPSAIPMRHEIEKQILEGKDDDAIVAHFVEETGTKVLSAPPARGLNLAAWVMPGFALGVGLFAAWYFAARWASKRRLAAVSAKPSVVDAVLRDRIEKELKG